MRTSRRCARHRRSRKPNHYPSRISVSARTSQRLQDEYRNLLRVCEEEVYRKCDGLSIAEARKIVRDAWVRFYSNNQPKEGENLYQFAVNGLYSALPERIQTQLGGGLSDPGSRTFKHLKAQK